MSAIPTAIQDSHVSRPGPSALAVGHHQMVRATGGPIRERLCPVDVTGYVPAYGRTGAITGGTPLTVFTAEGLLRRRAAPTGGDSDQVRPSGRPTSIN
jgi:hypothetical protein